MLGGSVEGTSLAEGGANLGAEEVPVWCFHEVEEVLTLVPPQNEGDPCFGVSSWLGSFPIGMSSRSLRKYFSDLS